jgi:hypothetical protein
MAKAAGTKTIITEEVSDEASEHFQLKIGFYTLSVTSATWGSASLESSRVGEEAWRPVKDASGNPIVFTADDDVVVVGNRDYRLNNIDYVTDIEFAYARSA